MKKTGFRVGMALLLVLVVCVTAFASIPESLVPVGDVVGLVLETDSVYVTEVVEDSAAQKAGVKAGDVIVSINGRALQTAKQLSEQVRRGGETVTLGLRRGETARTLTLTVQRTAGERKLGVYVRDGVTGIGTVTFYDPATDTYGALGHGVCLPHTQQLLTLSCGSAHATQVMEIVKGRRGAPGALKGALSREQVFATIADNTASGIFGTVTHADWGGTALPVAQNSEIRIGGAQILSTVGTQTKSYHVEIQALYPDEKNGRNMLISVTDPALLEQTNGIVQGMSGSPILQNGKLVGAITHVLVDDPAKGYGIFICNMLNMCEIYRDNG